jgi:hypothetical protein
MTSIHTLCKSLVPAPEETQDRRKGSDNMPKKGELSKTARASLANREEINHLTERVCAKCGEAIMLKELQPVKVVGKGMVYYHKSHYNVQ